ncbi:MAG: hypothetical protein WC627_07155 [Legionella sp.]
MTIERVVILMAMSGEAAPLIHKLGLTKSTQKLPLLSSEVFIGKVKEKDVFLVTNGQSLKHKVDKVATQPAAVTTYAAILAFQPDLIINAGTAGGFEKRGAVIGDVYIGTSTVYHDRRIDLGDFKAFGLGANDGLPADFMSSQLGLKKGAISTGNSLDASDTDKELMEQNSAVIKEMEAAAIVECAQDLEQPIPVMTVKSITDIVDHLANTNTPEQFQKNFSLAVTNLAEKTEAVVNFVMGQSLDYIAKGTVSVAPAVVTEEAKHTSDKKHSFSRFFQCFKPHIAKTIHVTNEENSNLSLQAK